MTGIAQEMEDLLASCDLVTPLILDTSDATMNLELEDVIVTPKPRRGRKKRTNVDPNVKLEKERERCSNYRQRQRNERERLQQEEKILVEKLATLQETRMEKELSSTSVWKLFAQNQLEARVNAEAKQRRLYQAIEARASYIREFHELSQRRIANDELTLSDLQTESDTASTIPFCKLYVQDLDGVHAQTEDCLHGFNEFSRGKTWEEDIETGSIQFMERQELLCDFEQACQTLWDASQLRHRQECRREFPQVPDPDTMLAFNFRVSTRLSSGQTVSALQRVISRRYRTRDRFVYVWQSYADGEGMFTGLRAGETGWDVLTRSVDTCGLEKVTRATVIWHTSIDIDNAVIPEIVAKEFTTMTIGSVAEDVGEITKRFQEVNVVV